MPDLGPAVATIAELAGPAARRAGRVFLATTFGMIATGVLVAVGSVWYVGQVDVLRGLGAGLTALLIFGIAGGVLGGQRAAGAALLEALVGSGLGSRTVGALFRALAEGPGGQTLARLPLATAQQRLHELVRAIITSPEAGGGLSGKLGRRIRRSLLERIERLTMARFRAEGTGEGGIDLEKIGDELAEKTDELLADQIRGAMQRITVVLVLVALALQIAAAVALRRGV